MTLNVAALNELIAHLEKQPEERFNMGTIFDNQPLSIYDPDPRVPDYRTCDTVACIAGHCAIVMRIEHGKPWAAENAERWLGLEEKESEALFEPMEWRQERDGVRRYPLSRAIATLKRLRDVYEATGQVVVNWGPEPGEEPKREWSAPVVSGGLPSSITDVLDGKPLSLTVEQVDG